MIQNIINRLKNTNDGARIIVNLHKPLNLKNEILHFGGDFYHDLNPLDNEDYNQLVLEDANGKNVGINLKNIVDFSLV